MNDIDTYWLGVGIGFITGFLAAFTFFVLYFSITNAISI